MCPHMINHWLVVALIHQVEYTDSNAFALVTSGEVRHYRCHLILWLVIVLFLSAINRLERFGLPQLVLKELLLHLALILVKLSSWDRERLVVSLDISYIVRIEFSAVLSLSYATVLLLLLQVFSVVMLLLVSNTSRSLFLMRRRPLGKLILRIRRKWWFLETWRSVLRVIVLWWIAWELLFKLLHLKSEYLEVSEDLIHFLVREVKYGIGDNIYLWFFLQNLEHVLTELLPAWLLEIMRKSFTHARDLQAEVLKPGLMLGLNLFAHWMLILGEWRFLRITSWSLCYVRRWC